MITIHHMNKYNDWHFTKETPNRWCSSVPIVERPTQKSSYVHISYVGASKEMKIVENYEMKLVFLTSPP